MKQLAFLGTILTAVLVFWACETGDGDTPDKVNFDRTTLLQNMANNLIKPNFAALNEKVGSMDKAIQAFAAAPTEANLVAAQNAWDAAYTAWQHANMFNFGPAEIPVYGTLQENIGLFPVNVAKIEQNIATNKLSFDNFDRDTRGFLTLDYLLFDMAGNAAALAKYTGNAEVRKQYLQKVSADIKDKVAATNSGWQTYTDAFIKNNGTDAGSSTSYLYNEWIKSFEGIKNFKVQLPAGKRAGQTKTEPEKVEAYYSGNSVKYLNEHLKAIDNVWYGRSREGRDGVGFEEYLTAVTGGNELITSTKTQWAAVTKAAQAIPAQQRLSATINSNLAVVDALGTELQKHTRFFKSDMSSLLGIAITFSSGDGD